MSIAPLMKVLDNCHLSIKQQSSGALQHRASLSSAMILLGQKQTSHWHSDFSTIIIATILGELLQPGRGPMQIMHAVFPWRFLLRFKKQVGAYRAYTLYRPYSLSPHKKVSKKKWHARFDNILIADLNFMNLI